MFHLFPCTLTLSTLVPLSYFHFCSIALYRLLIYHLHLPAHTPTPSLSCSLSIYHSPASLSLYFLSPLLCLFSLSLSFHLYMYIHLYISLSLSLLPSFSLLRSANKVYNNKEIITTLAVHPRINNSVICRLRLPDMVEEKEKERWRESPDE